METINVLVIAVCLFSFRALHAQNAILVTGGNASGSEGSASYSIGQVVYTTNSGANGSVAQGVQHPFIISVETGTEDLNRITLGISAYPNPATDFLVLKVDNFDNTNLSYQLLDISGRLIENKRVESNSTNIFMGNLVPTTYFLKVSIGTREVKTFKILKIK